MAKINKNAIKKNKLLPSKKEYYEWNDLVDIVESASGKNTQDWANANRYTNFDFKTGNFPAAIWATKQGYDWRVLDDIYLSDGTKQARVGEELELRIKINEEFQDYLEKNPGEDTPYQNFWHYLTEKDFCEVSNGSFVTFNPTYMLESIKDEDLGEYNFVKEIIPYFISALKDNGLPEEIEVSVSW